MVGASGFVELVNVLGQTVRSVPTVRGGVASRLSSDDLAPGLYFLRTNRSGVPVVLTR